MRRRLRPIAGRSHEPLAMPLTDLEKELRAALRPVDPDEGFAERLRARMDRDRRRAPRRPPASLLWLPAALAASLLLCVGVLHERELARQRQGLEARRQLIEALRVTGEKLDLAYRGVSDASRPPRAGDAGA
jgi:hypothetical protein